MAKAKVKVLRVSAAEQLRRWVDGVSVHRAVGKAQGSYECCPDFSCCNPELLAPVEKRKQFAAASQSERDRMCFEFLGGMLTNNGCEVVS